MITLFVGFSPVCYNLGTMKQTIPVIFFNNKDVNPWRRVEGLVLAGC